MSYFSIVCDVIDAPQMIVIIYVQWHERMNKLFEYYWLCKLVQLPL